MISDVEDFLTYIASEKGLALNTIESYGRDIRTFVAYLNRHGVPCFSAVQQQHIVDYLLTLKNQDYASASVARALMAIKVLFRFLKRENVVETNVALYLESPKLWRLIPTVLTGDEMERLLAQPDLQTFEGARDKAILEMLYGSGLRVSELCRLTIYDVDDQGVRVMGKGSKERIVPVGQHALDAVDYYVSHFRCQHETRVNVTMFLTSSGIPINRTQVWKMIKDYGKQAGIVKTISPHTMRHTFATHLLDNGADLRIIQELLGHANISSTDRYTQVSAVDLQHRFNAHHPRK